MISGKQVTRLELNHLKSLATPADTIIISSVDRLARSVQAAYAVLGELIETGAKIHSTDMGQIDLEDETSLIQFNLRSLVADLEHKRIVYRLHSAIKAKARDGRLPTGLYLYGYRYDKNTKTAEIDPLEALIVRRIFAEAATGKAYTAIAEGLRIDEFTRRKGSPWQHHQVAMAVENTAYKGSFHSWGNIINLPPIVSETEWQAAQRPKGVGRKSRSYLLTGHLRCGNCGYRMSGKAVKRADDGSKYNYYYRCTARPGYMQCGKTLVRMNDMHEVVERELRKLMSDRAALLELLAMADEKRPERDKQLAALQDEDKRWLEAYQAGAITASELREYRAELVKKRQALLEVRNEAYPLDDYVRAAATMPIADLLKLTNAVVHVFTDHLEVELGG